MTRQDKAQRDVPRLQRGEVLKNLYRQYSENLSSIKRMSTTFLKTGSGADTYNKENLSSIERTSTTSLKIGSGVDTYNIYKETCSRRTSTTDTRRDA